MSNGPAAMDLEQRADAIADAVTRYMDNFEDNFNGKREQALNELRSLGLRPEHIDKIHRCIEVIHLGYLEMYRRDDLIDGGSASMQ